MSNEPGREGWMKKVKNGGERMKKKRKDMIYGDRDEKVDSF